MKITEIIGIIVCVPLAIWIIFIRTGSFFNRHIRSYNKEINQFLRKRGLEAVEIRFPRKDDWKYSPFKKRSVLTSNIVRNCEHRVIIAKNKYNSLFEFWIEVQTVNYLSPGITIKSSAKAQEDIDNSPLQDDVITNFSHCPACNYKLSEFDKECPDCGLNFV